MVGGGRRGGGGGGGRGGGGAGAGAISHPPISQASCTLVGVSGETGSQ